MIKPKEREIRIPMLCVTYSKPRGAIIKQHLNKRLAWIRINPIALAIMKVSLVLIIALILNIALILLIGLILIIAL